MSSSTCRCIFATGERNMKTVSWYTKTSLRTKLLTVGLACFLLSSIITTSRSVSRLNEALNESAVLSAKSELYQAAEEVKESLNGKFSVIRNLAQTVGTIQLERGKKLNRDDVIHILRNLHTQVSGVTGIWTLWEPNAFDGLDESYKNKPFHDKTGRFLPNAIRTSSGEIKIEPNVDYETDGGGDYYLIAKRTMMETIMEPYYYKVDGKDLLLTTITVPIIHDGKFLGAFGIDIALDFVQAMADEKKFFSGAGRIVLISNKGQIAGFAGQKQLVTKQASDINTDFYQGPASSRLNGKASTAQDALNLSVIQPIELAKTNTPWLIEAYIPLDAVNKPIRTAAYTQIALNLAISLGSLLLLALVINQANKSLSTATDDLKKVADATEENSEGLTHAAEALSSSNVEQAVAVQEVAATMEEFARTISLMAQNADESSRLAGSCRDVSQSGQLEVQKMIAAIHAMQKQNEETSDSMQKRQMEFGKITDIFKQIEEQTKVINDIVFQTKLLSFNASVEAAHAGEHGKGFGVVAEEIAKLTRTSGDAAKEIGILLTSSTSHVQAIVDETKRDLAEMMEKSQTSIKGGVVLARNCEVALERIVKNASDLDLRIRQVGVAAEEQAKGVKSLSTAVSEIEKGMQDNERAAGESLKMAESTSQQAKLVIEVVGQLEETIKGS